MDAHELKPFSLRGLRPQAIHLVLAWLGGLLAVGLWQSYGAWLLNVGAGHAA